MMELTYIALIQTLFQLCKQCIRWTVSDRHVLYHIHVALPAVVRGLKLSLEVDF